MEWLLLIPLAFLALPLFKRWRRTRRERFIRDYQFHSAVEKSLAKTQPHLDVDQRRQVLEALRGYFLLCLRSKPMVAMPSLAVDDAWHAFILYTRAYEQFCRRAFGRFLHHTPAEAYPASLSGLEVLRHTWHLACKQEGINPTQAERLPALFAIDRELAIPDGYYYLLDCTGQREDAEGKPQFCAAALANIAPKLKRSPRWGKGGGSVGADCAGDSGCGGSSCGGGCGGS